MKTVAADDKAGSVVVNQPVIDQKTGEKRVKNDMTKAPFDVDVDVGPSSSSKRAATVRALTGIAATTDDPETKQALTFSTIANLEDEGLGDLRDWARARAVRMGIMKPTEEEKQELSQEQANQQPDPQAAYLLAEAEKSKADTGLKAAQTEKAKADTAATLAGIDADQRQQAIDAAKTILDVTNQHADRVQKLTGF